MQSDVIIAGFGGQGVLLIGKMLAYAGMHRGLEVSWMPSYGPEMRGGTANCSVVLSDRPIGSPVIQSPRCLMVLNLPSLDKFEDDVKPGGLIVVNTSLVPREVRRTDVRVCKVPGNDVAVELKNPRGVNMVMLGAFLGATGVLEVPEIEPLVHETFGAKPRVVEANLVALARGHAIGKAFAEEGR
jgi:2-oxoglutarate ferredoxin oxidoreductase subunit gamma